MSFFCECKLSWRNFHFREYSSFYFGLWSAPCGSSLCLAWPLWLFGFGFSTFHTKVMCVLQLLLLLIPLFIHNYLWAVFLSFAVLAFRPKFFRHYSIMKSLLYQVQAVTSNYKVNLRYVSRRRNNENLHNTCRKRQRDMLWGFQVVALKTKIFM